MNGKERRKKLPGLKTDEEAERFVDEADLAEYDLSGFKPTRFEFEKKTARVNMRLPEPLLEAVKRRASARGIPCQRLIREALEREISRDQGRPTGATISTTAPVCKSSTRTCPPA